MDKQPIFQGPFWRRYSNAVATGPIADTPHSSVGLGAEAVILNLQSNDLAMGTLTYQVLIRPVSDERPHTNPVSDLTDMFSTVTSAKIGKGTTVRITARPTSTRYVWDHFENAAGQRLNSNTGQIDITLNQSMTVRGVFRQVNTGQNVTLTVSYDHAKGTVTASPALTNDQVTVPLGASVVLTATPKQGYAFKQWRNALVAGQNNSSPTEPVHTEQMKVGNKTIYADFVKVQGSTGGQTTKTVTVKWNGNMGKVTGNGLVPDSKTGSAKATVTTGDSITISATPKSGYRFVKWTGSPVNGNTDESVNFAVNANYTLYAEFAADNGGDPGNGGGGGGGGYTPEDPGTPGSSATTSTGAVMAFVKKWWWALLIAAYIVYDATKGGRK